ncbi:T9SS type A sorting domain-containing protein [Carboxylicivirga marina]|uniref:T9SS type A sorting domain-containing protein n=1 Tax=Carboxylicivirga marina TaxID=2800988 RepID=UPI002597B2C7|nr:family 16 glycosylhydrolase [uncultured Carboxylicivirga sp.]
MIKYFALIIFIFAQIDVGAQNFVDQNTTNSSPLISIGADYVLEFSDEFNDNTLNTDKWSKQLSSKSRAARPTIGIDDWWWKEDHVWLENGMLVLKVSKHDANTMHCGSVNTNDKYERQYGYYETRIKVAEADKGTHTAFWFQGDNMSQVDDTANDGAEIDVFESAWTDEYTKSVIHIDGYGNDHQANTKRYETPGIHSGYHTWGLWWTKDFLKIYYDGVLKVTYDDPKWLVHTPEFIWLSDGASFGLEGDEYFINRPIGTLTHAYVDYVRVWRQTEDEPSITIMDLEAEDALVSGDAYTESCNNASNQEVLNLRTNGMVSFEDIDLEMAGSYNLRVSYISGNNRQAELFVNGAIVETVDFSSSGAWCYDGGHPATIDIPVDMNVSANTIQLRSTGVAGPHIDKISIIQIQQQTGIEDFNRLEEAIQVYMNGKRLVVNNNHSLQIESIELYNMSGKLIDNLQFPDTNKMEFDVKSSEPGVYLVRMKIEQYHVVKKVVVNSIY